METKIDTAAVLREAFHEFMRKPSPTNYDAMLAAILPATERAAIQPAGEVLGLKKINRSFEKWHKGHRSARREDARRAWEAAAIFYTSIAAPATHQDAKAERAATVAKDREQVGDVSADLAILVRRLVRRLEKDSPGTDIAPQAIDFLKRKGLLGSPLREESPVAQPAVHGEAEVLSPLDYRAQGREEALAIILAEDPEDPFTECTSISANGDCGDYSTHWDEDALRALLAIGDRTHDAYDRAEAAYCDAIGMKDSARWEMNMVERAPFYKPLTEFLSKHKAWDLMASLKRAAPVPAPQAGHSDAARDVLAERQRQMDVEDWSPEHDDAHPSGEIAAFAAVYAMPEAARDWPATETGYGDTFGVALCPEDWRPKFGDRRRELVKAGALILAEIERLDRATPSPQGAENNNEGVK